MKNKTYILNTLLAVVLGIYYLILTMVRAFAPQIILPQWDIPGLVLISLVALVLEHYLVPDAPRCYICTALFSAATFGLLTFCVLLGIQEAFKLTVAGGVVFTATTWLFTTIQDRLSSGPAAKASAFFSAVSLYMAAQCFMGMIL